MAGPTLFNSPMRGFIQQESIRNYHQQLAQKNGHLDNAKSAYQNALDLVEQFGQKVIIAEGQLDIIKNDLANCSDSKEIKKLELQKKQYERFIETAPEKLAPITQRLNQLAENLQRLEEEISTIIEQARESRNTSPGAGG
ncbi:hypothetical protein [Legionella maioricensis]|uniref:Uncharacterized protein n=1 Tax=Legionella maioricensis TaxID=2896528 RepID=A0A9X2D3Q7_9GAMM|nr:hypothetical protein [Legionella maioricensis]MCL9685698.1 hypothetical protein [Legionella maioricensis]MCL9689145.1 hypothetical protein [Legionella maioricensis]